MLTERAPQQILDRERAHQDAWYARSVEQRFFEREGFRRLQAWNLALLRRAEPALLSPLQVAQQSKLSGSEPPRTASKNFAASSMTS